MGSYTRAASGLCPILLGGLGGVEFVRLVRLRSFGRADMVAAARIGWIEVGRLSVRFAGVSVGTRRGKIVDCGGCLGVGSVGWQVSAKEKAREFRHRGPLVCVGVSTGVSSKSKWIKNYHTL